MADTGRVLSSIYYPEADGEPIAESDATRDYLFYCMEVLRLYFYSWQNIYVSGNLFVYYEEGNPKVVISPDVFVIFGPPDAIDFGRGAFTPPIALL